MKKIFLIFTAIGVAGILHAQPDNLKVKAYKLDNGLTVWLNEDHSQPSVFGAVVVKAGSKNCPATGIAHYFEHIMFKGTDKIGTTDYTAEKVYLDSIAQKYDELVATQNPEEREKIQKEINRISISAAQYAIPNEFNKLTSICGGSSLNAFTSYDLTCYHSTFSPQYINQWLELNSERLIHPVFRLFQGELETVYEEKNMYEDDNVSLAFQKVTERVFAPHPYQYPIIGTTDHLKNPQLSEMMDFFDKYYVAGNMGLILCGNFKSEDIIPVIREKFSRIRPGEAPVHTPAEIPQYNKTPKEHVLIPIPLIKGFAIIWKGIPNNSPDEHALKIISTLLANEMGNGYLNQLTNSGKLLSAEFDFSQLNEAGSIRLIVIPKLLFQSYHKAEELVFKQIERIKKGDFSEELLEQLKLNQKRIFQKNLENQRSRANQMIYLFSQNASWEDYLNESEKMNALTKADIVEVANRYLNDNYLYFKKKTGHYPKDLVSKPNFKPIVPPNRNATSAYAQQIINEALTTPVSSCRTLDFEKDARQIPLSEYVTFYYTPNPINDIFELSFVFPQGTDQNPYLEPMTQLLWYAGTDSLDYNECRSRLQKLGGSLNFSTSTDQLEIKISGFDVYFDQTMALVSHFFQRAQADKKKIHQIISEEKIVRASEKKSPQSIAEALLEYAIHGENSSFLKKPEIKNIKRKGTEGLLALFREIQKSACTIHYTGKLPENQITQSLLQHFGLNAIHKAGEKPVYTPIKNYNSPLIFFVDNPKATQSIIYSYTPSPNEMDTDFRSNSLFFNTYWGSGMSSLLFQEIREFRSYAYQAISGYIRPDLHNKQQQSYLLCLLSTQADKTTDALSVLDSLLKNMPEKEDKIPAVKQTLRNLVYNNYPDFRKISSQIANYKYYGYDSNPNTTLIQQLNSMDMSTLRKFYKENVKNQTTCYIITGNAKRIDMEKLKQFGEIKKLKIKDIFR